MLTDALQKVSLSFHPARVMMLTWVGGESHDLTPIDCCDTPAQLGSHLREQRVFVITLKCR